MDRSREGRIVVKAPVSFEGTSGTGKGTTFNLSLGGCALESGADVPMHATIKLNLHIPTGTKPVRVGRAKVTWTAGSDFGVEFLDMDQTGKTRLQQYIDTLRTKAPSKSRT
jgi:c-di-GMP-binding flagellar brake protein YcgR